MSAKIFSFLRPNAAPRDWSAVELGEFYRVESVLIQTGLQAVSARGLTDEGEPWFVFCRAEDDEVIIHFARIDGRYVISAPAYCGNAEGADFRALVRGIIERHPALRPRPNGDNLFLHPTALLVVLVTSALLKSSHAAEAAPIQPAAADPVETKYRGIVPAAISVAFAPGAMAHDLPQETLILAALAARLTAPLHSEPLTIVVPASAGLPEFPEQPSARPVNASLLDESRDVAGADSLAPASLIQPVTSPPAKAMSSLLVNVPLTDTLAHPLSPADDLVALTTRGEPATQAAALSESNSHLSTVTLVASMVDSAASAPHVSLSTLIAIPKADIDLLRALGASDNVAYLSTVPATLSTVLNSGMHKAASPVAALSHVDATAQTPAHPASTAVVAAPEAVPMAPASGAVMPHVNEATTTATGSVLSGVLAAVQAFQAVETHPVVLITDHSAIFYDAAPITTNLPAVKSITFDLGDGFSVSLVGLPAELAHASVHA